MNIFLKNICVILLVLGVTITLENSCDVSVRSFVYSIDHGFTNYFKPLNIIGAELKSGKKMESNNERKPGRYFVIWEKILSDDASRIEYFKIKEGQTGKIVLKSCD